MWLERGHRIRANAKTIQRVFCDLGMLVLTKAPRRKPKQLMLFEKDAPGDSIQVDVKVVKVQREKVFSLHRTGRPAHASESCGCISAPRISTQACIFSARFGARCPF